MRNDSPQYLAAKMPAQRRHYISQTSLQNVTKFRSVWVRRPQVGKPCGREDSSPNLLPLASFQKQKSLCFSCLPAKGDSSQLPLQQRCHVTESWPLAWTNVCISALFPNGKLFALNKLLCAFLQVTVSGGDRLPPPDKGMPSDKM